MKIALISHGSTSINRNFSGIPWSVLCELRRQGHIVEAFQSEPASWTRFLVDFKNRLSLKFTGQPHNAEADVWVIRTRAQRMASQVRSFMPDAVLCVGFPEAVCGMPEHPPLYVWMDALFPSVRRFYPYFKAYFSERNAVHLQNMESAALGRCRKIWLSSAWAADEAKYDFPDFAGKIFAQSFGANIDNPPSRDEIEKTIGARNLTEPTFLFIANEWERKGGEKAVETIARLRSNGCPAKLIVIGIQNKPASFTEASWIEWVGPLDKNKSDDDLRLRNYFSNSVFLLLPTNADCTPIVCLEAAAYGLPVLSTKVGGLSATVDTGKTGMLWPIDDFVWKASPWIMDLIRDKNRYAEMARAGRMRYESKGNWAVNVRAVAESIASDIATH